MYLFIYLFLYFSHLVGNSQYWKHFQNFGVAGFMIPLTMLRRTGVKRLM